MSVPVAIKTEEVILESTEYNSAEELDEELQLQLEDSGGESSYIQYQAEPQVSSHRRQQNSSMNTSGGSSTKNSGNLSGGGASNTNSAGGNANKSVLENEKRMRREIANSNERRRMQSINAGFQNLRSLLPRHEGDKLSKAAILQQTSQYICDLENQKTQLLEQNSKLKRQLGQHESTFANSGSGGVDATNSSGNTEQLNAVTIKKRKLTDNVINMQTDSSDEGLGSMSPEPMTLLNAAAGGVTAKGQVLINGKELLELKKDLEKERRLRTMLEDELQAIKRQLYSVATAPPQTASSSYIPREVIEHTDNLVRETMEELPAGTVSYVEIDEMTGQQQVVVCSSIEELEQETAAAAAEIITEDNVHEEVILSSTSSTESEQEVNMRDIAKAYVEGTSATVLQPILQAAIKATPKVEVERIHEIIKVKSEKGGDQASSSLTRSRQNLETIVEAIRHLEGDHLFSDGQEQQKLQQQQQQQKAQEAPLALTTKQMANIQQRTTLAELRPFLKVKGSKQFTISGTSVTLTPQQLAKVQQKQENSSSTGGGGGGGGGGSSLGGSGSVNISSSTSTPVTPTAIYKVQTSSSTPSSGAVGGAAQQVTITTTALKQCRPGVIVAKQLS